MGPAWLLYSALLGKSKSWERPIPSRSEQKTELYRNVFPEGPTSCPSPHLCVSSMQD